MDDYYLDYFYGQEVDAYSFIRIPKLLIDLPVYKDLASDEKLLYGILLDRMNLSVKNRWLDKKGRVFIIFTIEEVMQTLNCAQHKAVRVMTNLEMNAHLIERKRQGQGKPSIIYVKRFVLKPNAQSLNCRKNNSGIAETTIQELSKGQCNNTDSNNTDINNTDSNNTDLISVVADGNGVTGTRISYEDYFRKKLEIDLLKKNYPWQILILNGIFNLIVDTCSSKDQWIMISGRKRSLAVVRSRFMRLDKKHLEYVLGCLSNNKEEIQDMRHYLLATLYNVSITTKPTIRQKKSMK